MTHFLREVTSENKGQDKIKKDLRATTVAVESASQSVGTNEEAACLGTTQYCQSFFQAKLCLELRFVG